ncbi:hypothetical protein LAWI1_G008095 [Lachnellula willkommii]|uniref:Uncharacterized protein n=1 Tax=Lachnellula willkommii TaxID=215461 RepID=A0A559M057_9HELO|nr:hypothetical protein LAWI1_G008095 [Lachnellula willkommii]
MAGQSYFDIAGKRFASKRLDIILKGSNSAIITLEKYLNKIYLTILKYLISLEFLEEEKEEIFKDLYIILNILKDLTNLLRLYYSLFCDFLFNKD